MFDGVGTGRAASCWRVPARACRCNDPRCRPRRPGRRRCRTDHRDRGGLALAPPVPEQPHPPPPAPSAARHMSQRGGKSDRAARVPHEAQRLADHRRRGRHSEVIEKGHAKVDGLDEGIPPLARHRRADARVPQPHGDVSDLLEPGRGVLRPPVVLTCPTIGELRGCCFSRVPREK